MFNEILMVKITPFSGTSTPDKNNKMPVMLQCIAGKMPNRNTISGTVAERAGFEVGKTYIVQCRQRGFDDIFGEDFTWLPIKELTEGLDIAKCIKEFGKPEIINIPKPDRFYQEGYIRKGNAIESLQTKRIKEGLYHPLMQTSSDHSTAKEIKEGTSTRDLLQEVRDEKKQREENTKETLNNKG